MKHKIVMPAVGLDTVDYFIIGGMVLMLVATGILMVKKFRPETIDVPLPA